MVPFKSINLTVFKINSYLYPLSTKYDKGYKRVYEAKLNFRKKEDLILLLSFLREWKCRTIAHSNTKVLCENIATWHRRYGNRISQLPKLEKCKREHFSFILEMFHSLKETSAGIRNEKNIRISHVAASKILLILKGETFLPWDNGIIDKLGLEKSAESYIQHLQRAAEHLKDLKRQALRRGTTLNKYLFEDGKRHVCPLPKLIDEYYFLQFTKKIYADYVRDIAIG